MADAVNAMTARHASGGPSGRTPASSEESALARRSAAGGGTAPASRLRRSRPAGARRALSALGLALGLLAAPIPAAAHPHIFIDGGVDFLFDAAGRLERLRVTWIYDPLTSLLMLEDLGIDPGAGALSAADRRALAAYQTEWVEGFEGDSYLHDGGRRIGLSGPLAADAKLMGSRVAILFERAVATPFRPGPETVAKIYDPSYFTAYFVTEEPRLEGGASGCRAAVEPFEPTGPLMALQQSLFSIGIDAEPEDPDVGALFADRVHLRCD